MAFVQVAFAKLSIPVYSAIKLLEEPKDMDGKIKSSARNQYR
jgi:hypothetical protein